MQGSSEAKTDRDRFDTVSLAHIDSVYRFALYMMQDEEEAQKLVLYTYLKACKSPDRYGNGISCRICLLTILNDVIMKISPVFPRTAGRDNQDNAGVAVRRFSGIRFGEVAAAISELPTPDRAVVLLSDMEGLSYAEIATIVGYSIENVLFRLFRGRKLLIERLKATLNGRGGFSEQL